MMHGYGDGAMTGWGWTLMMIAMIVFFCVVVAAGVTVYRKMRHAKRLWPPGPGSGEELVSIADMRS